MSSKRHSIVPPVSQSGPKPPVQFSSSITIADSAILTGANLITISTESVIHPRAKIESLAGRINIGRRCVVQERATIGAVGSSGKIIEAAVTLGDYVTVEVAVSIEAGDTMIGEGTTIGVGSRIGAGAVIGKHCTITPHSDIKAGVRIPDYSVVYSNGTRRVDKRPVAEQLKYKGLARQIDVLRRMIPSNPAKFM